MIDNKVYTLLKVYECGSFVSAAKQLNITQPAVSQHIKALEDELSITIFERGKGKLVLTKQGNEVIKCAKKMVGIYSGLLQDISDGTSLTTHLTIGVTHTAESNPIAEALASYCSKNPRVNIKMITDTIKNLYSMLKTYEIDLAFIEGKMIDNDFKSILLDTDCLMLAVSNKNPLAKKTIATLSDLKKEKLILRLPNSGTRSLFESHLASNNEVLDSFNVILEVDNISTIKELVQNDFGVSILSKSACSLDLKEKRFKLIPVENLSMVREINIFYHHDFEHQGILTDIARIYYEMQKNNM